MKKHILCFGDSNTHGYCADPSDCADGGDRFNEQERWTCLLQDLLGDDCKVYEEGLSGRTTVFSDPLHESMDGLGVIYSTLMSHERVDLLIIMLGTNDTKERLGVNAPCIALGLERLIQKAKSVPAWKNDAPNILVVCPPHIGEGMYENPCGGPMGAGCPEKSRELAKYYRPPQGVYSEENLRMAQSLGYRTLFWSLAYVDWNNDAQPTREEAFAKLLPRIHNGAIVLLHSTSETNAKILDELLTKWEEAGYRFITPDELF